MKFYISILIFILGNSFVYSQNLDKDFNPKNLKNGLSSDGKSILETYSITVGEDTYNELNVNAYADSLVVITNIGNLVNKEIYELSKPKHGEITIRGVDYTVWNDTLGNYTSVYVTQNDKNIIITRFNNNHVYTIMGYIYNGKFLIKIL